MDEFFKLVNKEQDPTCAEANEYLAEDRVMCLQIYIKKASGFYLTYIPDAKAFTDAPPNLTVLLKQRRRWMNGALFAAFRVIRNLPSMVSCANSQHGVFAKLGMAIYMSYFVTMQILSFFMVGSMYVSIKLFYVDFFPQIAKDSGLAQKAPWLYNFFSGNCLVPFSTVFSFTYLTILVIVVLISIAMPIDRAMDYVRIVGVIFAVITLASMAGICVFLAEAGFFPPVKEFDTKTEEWVIVTGEGPYFSILTLSGVLMLSVYAIPFLLRPLDFIWNFVQYMIGFLSYLLLLPIFINVMQVYSMSNLHDVSWGNRPTANAGTGMLSINAKK